MFMTVDNHDMLQNKSVCLHWHPHNVLFLVFLRFKIRTSWFCCIHALPCSSASADPCVSVSVDTAQPLLLLSAAGTEKWSSAGAADLSAWNPWAQLMLNHIRRAPKLFQGRSLDWGLGTTWKPRPAVSLCQIHLEMTRPWEHVDFFPPLLAHRGVRMQRLAGKMVGVE